jgi:hypothetical protein
MRLVPADGTLPAPPLGGKVAPFGRERSSENTPPDTIAPQTPDGGGASRAAYFSRTFDPDTPQ